MSSYARFRSSDFALAPSRHTLRRTGRASAHRARFGAQDELRRTGRASADSLLKSPAGLPAVALAKAGGEKGIRTLGTR